MDVQDGTLTALLSLYSPTTLIHLEIMEMVDSGICHIHKSPERKPQGFTLEAISSLFSYLQALILVILSVPAVNFGEK